jgi:2-oxoglutarate ferredoxin oxidoreductase subunit alpha
LENTLIERYRRYDVIKATEQRSEGFMLDDAEYVVVAFGASARIARTAVVRAREKGIKVGLLRPITLWPYPADALRATVPTTRAYLSVEMNMGQMIDDVRLAVNCERPVEFFGRSGGVVPTPSEVLEAIENLTTKAGA